MDSAKQAAAIKCQRCRVAMKPDSMFCSNCGAAKAEQAAGDHSKVYVASIIALCIALAAILILFGVRSAASDQTVSAVYITPSPTPDGPSTIDAPVAKPATPPLFLLPTTQTVELSNEVHYLRMKTQMLGATTGGGPFEMRGIGDEPIIGFRVTTARWDGKSIVRTLLPVYGSDNSVVTQSMIVGRPGYAVGGVIVDGDDHVTAMQIVFMKILSHGLSLKNAYTSDWIGDPTGDPTHLLGGHGQFVIGIYGRKRDEC